MSFPELPTWLRDRLVDLFELGDEGAASELEVLCAENPNYESSIREGWRRAEDLLPQILPPPQIGPYRVLELIGEGGMGTVYLAQQEEPVSRRVAVKVIKLGMDSGRILRRFRREQQALATMDHPNIATIFDAGMTKAGRSFFAMEYVDGLPITTYCDLHRVSIPARLELFCQVCGGVQHAHQKRVIHRDLKPSNVLVTAPDGAPIVKIIDFGLSRALDEEEGEGSLLTRHDQALGTLEFVSPEQFLGSPHDVDTRADVFSLGVVLYELLTGALPFPSASLRGVTPEETLRAVRIREAPRPSACVRESEHADRVARYRRTDQGGLWRALRGDLDRIVGKAIEKDRDRRYDTPSELAADLRRVLRREPVSAALPTLGYRLRKYIARNRVAVITAAVVFLALTLALVSALWSNREVRRAERAQAKSASEANAARKRFGFLSYSLRLDRAKRTQAELYPANPAMEARLATWLREEGEPLVRALPELREALAALQRTLGKETAPADRQQQLIEEADRFLLETLQTLISDLVAFEERELASVRDRWAWARRVRAETTEKVAPQWQAAIEAVQSSLKYRGLVLEPQLGLVPLGKDAESGLQEFAHLRSGSAGRAIPTRDPATGQLRIDEHSGLVFVLLPGATFFPGSQSEDPKKENYDPAARPNEKPPGQVELPPFLISKFEVTQAQWKRLTEGENPSYRFPGANTGGRPVTWRNPVEQVSWRECASVFARYDLGLPTEAQWEYACRGGGWGPWHSGRAPASLEGYANISDRTAAAIAHWKRHVDFDDGYCFHAPVGTFTANAFGLHDMHGNVWEWCAGPPDHAQVRAVRGGSFMSPAVSARTTHRGAFLKTHRYQDVGVRPIRAVKEGS